MRLWHKDLVSVLPRQQLLGQWRELNSIYKLENRHILINFVYDYFDKDFWNYSHLVLDEMNKRGYKTNLENFDKYFSDKICMTMNCEDIFRFKMNDRYLRQCIFNLEEKFDCGAITNEEWGLIKNKVKRKELLIWRNL